MTKYAKSINYLNTFRIDCFRSNEAMRSRNGEEKTSCNRKAAQAGRGRNHYPKRASD